MLSRRKSFRGSILLLYGLVLILGLAGPQALGADTDSEVSADTDQHESVAPSANPDAQPDATENAPNEPADGPNQAAQDAHPLEKAIEGMRSAQRRIAESDTGPETRTIQQTVVDELDKLIRQARNQQQRPNPSQSRQFRQNRQNASRQRQNDDEKDASEQQTSQSQAGPSAAGAQAARNAQDSQPGTNETEDKKREADDARRRRLLNDVWGHLPERVRQRLMNRPGEKYLPEYDETIRRYYEALAEEGTEDGPSSP